VQQQQQHQHQALMADHTFGVLLSILVPERSTLSAFPEITIRESGNYYFIWTGMMLAVGFFPMHGVRTCVVAFFGFGEYEFLFPT